MMSEGSKGKDPHIRSLAAHSFSRVDRFYNCGSIARPSKDASIYAGLGFASRGWEPMLSDIRARLGSLFATDDHALWNTNQSSKVALFHNTTSAVQRVLSRVLRELGGRDVSLLTTDFEYPGCIAALDDQWDGVVTMAEVARHLGHPTVSHANACNALKAAFLIVRPRVVYLSHVCRYTGFVVNADLLRFFRDVNPRCVIILDGSQALGNLVVRKELLDETDFYISSGHKWLGGFPALGVVWCDDVNWKIDDPAQSTALTAVMGGTANDRALLSAERAACDFLEPNPYARLLEIEEHNKSLASLFVELVSHTPAIAVALRPITKTPYHGLVSFTLEDPRYLDPIKLAAGGRSPKAEPAVTYLATERWLKSQIGPSHMRWVAKNLLESHPSLERFDLSLTNVTMPPKPLIRFCFHYYHSSHNVHRLVRRLERELRRVSRSKRRKRSE